LYRHCLRTDTAATVARLERCLLDVSHWTSANRLKLNPDKTELVQPVVAGWQWPVSAVRLGHNHGVRPCSCARRDFLVRPNWTNMSPRSAQSFFWLRQLRRVRRSLDDESMKTMVHAFVTTRVDFCNTVFANAPRYVTDKLQRVMNAASRLVSGTRKYDRGLSQLLHVDLHWLDVADLSSSSSA